VLGGLTDFGIGSGAYPHATLHRAGLEKFSSAKCLKWDPLSHSEIFLESHLRIQNFSGTPARAAPASHAPGLPRRDAAQVRSGVQPWPLRISPLPPLTPSNAWALSIRPAGKRGSAVIEYRRDPPFGIIEYRNGHAAPEVVLEVLPGWPPPTKLAKLAMTARDRGGRADRRRGHHRAVHADIIRRIAAGGRGLDEAHRDGGAACRHCAGGAVQLDYGLMRPITFQMIASAAGTRCGQGPRAEYVRPRTLRWARTDGGNCPVLQPIAARRARSQTRLLSLMLAPQVKSGTDVRRTKRPPGGGLSVI
jgi:hypothetical protein